MDDGDDCKFLV